MTFVGREREIERLGVPAARDAATLIVLYGRRRVGKTSLVEHAFRDQALWKFEGLEAQTQRAQLAHFQYRLSLYTSTSLGSLAPPTTWTEALDRLSRALRSTRTKPLTLFFDEFQWMAGMKTGLIALFKSFWDNVFSKHAQLRVILCGSISSFMVKRVIRSKALYGRVHHEIHLLPLPLSAMGAFFPATARRMDVLDGALCFGGVPAYLAQLDPCKSLLQNLNELAFTKDGYFVNEFQRIFVSHFGKNALYQRIVVELLDGERSAEQLAHACKTTTGGGFTELLTDLAMAGFIERYSPVDKSLASKVVRYRLDDEYLHFYARLIRPRLREITQGQFAMMGSLLAQPYAQWRGYAFERLVRKNRERIAQTLGFAGIQYQAGTWFRRGDAEQRGAQIDLLYIRADGVLTICEAKYLRKVQSGLIEQSINQKLAALETVFPKHGVQRVLIVASEESLVPQLRNVVDEILIASEDFRKA